MKTIIKEAVHCPTIKEAHRLLAFAHKNGYEWSSKIPYIDLNGNFNDYYDYYKGRTCYAIENGGYCNIEYYKNKEYKIMTVDEFINNKKKQKMELKKIHVGKKFAASINGVSITDGKIQSETGGFYLCQNRQSGATCKDTLGYRYSWSVGSGSEADLKSNGVTDFKVFVTPGYQEDDKEFYEGMTLKRKNDENSFYVEARLGNMVFTSRESYECDGTKYFSGVYLSEELYKMGFRIYLDPKDFEENVPEYTMEEIVKMVGHNLKIKK